MNPYFPGDMYETPAERGRDWLDRLGGNGRFFYYLRFAAIIFQARWQVARGVYDQAAWAHTSYRLFRLAERSGGHFHISGLRHVAAGDEPVVIVSNHMSLLENAVTPCLVAPVRPVTFVLKASLLRYPIFGPMVASQRPVPVDREHPRADFERVMSQGAQLLAEGVSLVIYPEGTRRRVFTPEAFNSLGAKLARKAGVRLLPLAVRTDFVENGRYLRDFGPLHRDRPIYLAFGEPIDVAGNGRAAHQAAVDFIAGRLAAWGAPVVGR